MRDLTSFGSMKLKAALFVFIGLFSGVLLVFGPDLSAWQKALLLAMCVWAFCRVYYFAFYVIEKYVDPGFRFSGLGSAMRYLLGRKQDSAPLNESFSEPPTTVLSTGSQRLPIKWWLLWLFTFMLASVIPWFHLREDVSGIIEPLRYPWGLLPVHWLFLRHLGEISWYILGAYALAGVLAWEKPTWGRSVMLTAIMLHMTFATLHTLYSSKLVTGFIKELVARSEATERAENSTPAAVETKGNR